MESKHGNKIVNGVKILLTAATVTGSIGLWSTLSLRAAQAASQNTNSSNSSNTTSQSSISTSSLRVVNMDVPQSAASGQPVVQTFTVNQGNNGAPSPFTNTRTS
jgi:hypothetical protein